MSATALLMNLQRAGLSIRADGGDLVVEATDEEMTPLLLSELRDRKPVLLALLTGRWCRYCEGQLDWTRPAVSLVDGTAAHFGCYEEAEIARLLAAGERAVAGVVETSDDGELLVEGEP